MEIVKLIQLTFLAMFSFAAVFTTADVVACLVMRSDDYKTSATLASFFWAMVIVLLRVY